MIHRFLMLFYILSNVYAADSYLDKSTQFFNQLNINNMQLVGEFYDEKIEFFDPLGKIQGLLAMENYYRTLYVNVESIRFEFDHLSQNDNQVFLGWRMLLKSKLKKNEETLTHGTSIIVFNPESGKAIYHRDYFDLYEFVYQHIWPIGFVLEKVNGLLKE